MMSYRTVSVMIFVIPYSICHDVIPYSICHDGFQDEEKCSPLLWVQKELDGHFVAYVVFTFNFNSLTNDHI